MNCSDKITREQLCRMFDHTNLKAYADKDMLQTLCEEAKENHCAMVAINSSPVSYCKELLKDTDIHVGAAISFPLGQTTVAAKVFEAQNAIENGADEIDYVINIGELKNKNYQYIESEMKAMVELCRSNKVISKVIFEICYLTEDEIKKVSEIAKKVKPDYIKTSTGFGTSGAVKEIVRLMKNCVGEDVKVKAAGGIRSWKTCAEMIDAGAERIGTISTIKILQEFDEVRAGKSI